MGMTMPHLTPPRFVFAEQDGNTYIIFYYSKRPGLCPMVVGLLEGLAAKYNVKASIEFLKAEEGQEEKKFKITLLE